MTRLERSRARRIDRDERECRRRARHGLCTACGVPATQAQLCDDHSRAAFALGLVLH